MASVNQSCFVALSLAALFLCLLHCSESTRVGIQRNVPGTWCIANPVLGADRLQQAIDFCCSQPGVNCGIIQPGGSCYDPNTVIDHASVALDLYFKATGSVAQNCYTNSWGITTVQDPSHGSCVFP